MTSIRRGAGVARASCVGVTAVTCHFQTREGLMEALMDFLYADPVADLVEETRDLPNRAPGRDAPITPSVGRPSRS